MPDTTHLDELKPCPFDATHRVWLADEQGIHNRWYGVGCRDAECPAAMRAQVHKTAAAAIAAWNRRATPAVRAEAQAEPIPPNECIDCLSEGYVRCMCGTGPTFSASTQPGSQASDVRGLVEEAKRVEPEEDAPGAAGLRFALGHALSDALSDSEIDAYDSRNIDPLVDAVLGALLDRLGAAALAQAVAEGERIGLHEWAVSRWRDEVQNRPMVNVYRRTLDSAWRQVIRYAGGDPDAIVGPSHDALLDAARSQANTGDAS